MEHQCYVADTKEKLISKTIFTPYCKGICFVTDKEWEEILKIVVNNPLLSSLNFIIEFRHKLIKLNNASFDWYIKGIVHTYPFNEERYMGFCAENFALYFSKTTPNRVLKIVNDLYIVKRN